MISAAIIIMGILKVFKDYKRGFIKKVKGIASLVTSVFLYPLITPFIKEIICKTGVTTYLNEFNLLLINVLSTDLGGNLPQDDTITSLMSSTIVSLTQVEIKILSLVCTVFAANILFSIIFSVTDLISKFVLTAQIDHILGAATGFVEFSFYVCVILAFVYLICIYVESPVIMNILKGDQLLDYIYINNPVIDLLFD